MILVSPRSSPPMLTNATQCYPSVRSTFETPRNFSLLLNNSSRQQPQRVCGQCHQKSSSSSHSSSSSSSSHWFAPYICLQEPPFSVPCTFFNVFGPDCSNGCLLIDLQNILCDNFCCYFGVNCFCSSVQPKSFSASKALCPLQNREEA